MFEHTVVLIRPDTTEPFFYDKFGILTATFYVNLLEECKARGEVISDEITLSPDNLVLEKKIVWAEKTKFDTFYDAYLLEYPDYRDIFKAYNDSVNHMGIFSESE